MNSVTHIEDGKFRFYGKCDVCAKKGMDVAATRYFDSDDWSVRVCENCADRAQDELRKRALGKIFGRAR